MRVFRVFTLLILSCEILFASPGLDSLIIPAEILVARDSMTSNWGCCIHEDHPACLIANPLSVDGTSDPSSWFVAIRRSCTILPVGNFQRHVVVLQFNTSVIPDEALIEQIYFGFQVSSLHTSFGGSFNVQGYDMLNVTGGPAMAAQYDTLYKDATSGDLYFSGVSFNGTGNYEITLTEAAEVDLQTLLSSNWFALSMMPYDVIGTYDTAIAQLQGPEDRFYIKVFYNNGIDATVRTSFSPGGTVIVDDTSRTSPYAALWGTDDPHTISVDSIQNVGTGVRWEFRNWSDGGARTHEVIAPDADIEYVANFDQFYRLLVLSPYGEPTGATWHTPGTSINIDISPLTAYNEAHTIRHIFRGWSGSGSGSYTGPNHAATIFMNAPITQTALWDTSYFLSLEYAGMPAPGPTTFIGEGWYNPTSWVDIFANDSVLIEGIWYKFVNWSGGIFLHDSTENTNRVRLDYPITITAHYQPDPEIHVFPTNGIVANPGDTVRIYAHLSAVVPFDIDSFQFDMRVDTTRMTFIRMENVYFPWSDTSYWRYADTLRTKVTQPAPTTINPPESLFCYVFRIPETAPFGDVIMSMSRFRFDFNDGTTHAGTLFVRPETVAVNVQNSFAGGTVTVDGTPQVSPFLQRWVGGTSHSIVALEFFEPFAGLRLVFDAWADGITSRTRTVVPISDTTFTANFDSLYYLDVVSPYGTVSGEGYYAIYTSANFSVTPETLIETSGLTRRIFESWSGEYSGIDNPATIWLNEPATETAIWHTEHLLSTTYSGCGAATPTVTGAGWVIEDAWQNITTPATVIDGGTTYYFVQWTGGHVENRFAASTRTRVIAPATVTAVYSNTPFFVKITPPETFFAPTSLFEYPIMLTTSVVSINVDMCYIEVHFPASLSVESIINGEVAFDSIRAAFAEGVAMVRMFGEVELTHGDTLFKLNFSPSAPYTSPLIVRTANPAFDFAGADIDTGNVFLRKPVRLAINTSRPGAAATVNGTLRPLPTSIDVFAWDTINVSTPISQEIADGARLVFASWSDAAPRERTIILRNDSTITANYDREFFVQISSVYGTASLSGWFAYGSMVPVSVAPESVFATDRYHRFVRWDGSGTISYSGTSNPTVCYANSPITEIAIWNDFYNLQLSYSGAGAASPVLTGAGFFASGTHVPVTAPVTVVDGGTTYHFLYWIGDVENSLLPSTNAIMSAPQTVTAVYGNEPVAFVIKTPDTVYADLASYVRVPLVLNGALTCDGAQLRVHYDLDFLGMVDIFSQFPDGAVIDFPHLGYADISLSATTPIDFAYGDTLFNLLFVTKDRTGTSDVHFTDLSGDLSGGMVESFVLKTGATVHIQLQTCAVCTLIVDGAEYVGAYETNVNAGKPINVQAKQLVFSGTNSRKSFSHWASGASRVFTLTPTEDFSDIAHYTTQFTFELHDDFLVNSLEWADSGSAKVFSTFAEDIAKDSALYRFTSWHGVGDGSYSGTSNPATCILHSPIIQTAVRETLFALHISADATDAEVLGTNFYRSGTWASIYASLQANGKKFSHFAGGTFVDATNNATSVHMVSPLDVTAHYVSGFVALGCTAIPLTSRMCLPLIYHGASFEADAATLRLVFDDSKLRFDGVGSCAAFVATFDSAHAGGLFTLNMNFSSTLPTSVDDGDTIACVCLIATNSGTTRIYTENLAGDFLGIQGGIAEIKSGTTAELTINGPAGAEFTLDGSTQSFAYSSSHVQNSRHIIITPEEISYAHGTAHFSRWNDGLLTHEREITVISDTIISAQYDTLFEIDVTSAHGTVLGAGYYPRNWDAYVQCVNDTVWSAGTRASFEGWSGSISSIDNPLRFDVVGDEEFTAVWNVQHRLSIQSEFGNATGAGWKDAWTIAFASISPDSLIISANSRARFTNWSGDTTTTTNPVGLLMVRTRPLVANWTLRHRVVATSEFGTVTGGGWFNEGSACNISVAPTSIDVTADSKKRFVAWHGRSTLISTAATSFAVTKPESLWARWISQYYLTVSNGGHGTVSASGWHDEGATVNISVTPEIVTETDGATWKFTGWTGTGTGSYTGARNPATVHVHAAIAQTANWIRQYELTLATSGCGSAAPTISGAGFYNMGASAEIFAQNVVYDGEIRYHFHHWTGGTFADSMKNSTTVTVDDARTVTAVYIAFEISPVGEISAPIGTEITIPIVLFRDMLHQLSNGQFFIYYTSSVLSFVRVQESATGVDWSSLSIIPSGDSVRVFSSVFPYWALPPETLYEAVFTVIAPGVGKVWLDRFGYAYSGAYTFPAEVYAGNPVPITVTTDMTGASYIKLDGVVHNAPYTTDLAPGSRHTIEAYAEIPGDDDNSYVFASWSDGGARAHEITVSTAATFTANYSPRFALSVTSAVGIPWGSGYFATGDVANFGVDRNMFEENRVRFIFDGWNGSPAPAYTGSANPASFAITHKLNQVARWRELYYIDATTAFGCATGSGWYATGSSVTVACVPETIEITPQTERKVFVGWSGTAPTTANPYTFTAARPLDFVATWKDENRVIVQSKYGTISGSGWYIDGSTAHISVTPSEIDSFGVVRFVFEKFDGDIDTNASAFDMPISAPARINARWRKLVFIDVANDFGIITGENFYAQGDSVHVTCTSDTLALIELGLAFRCFVINGDTFAQQQLSFVAYQPETIFALFDTLATLEVVSDWGTTFGTGLYPIGATASFGVVPNTVNVDDGVRMIFSQWSGFGASAYSGAANAASFSILGRAVEQANWTKQLLFSVTSEHGHAVGAGWHDENSLVSVGIAPKSIIEGNTQYVFSHWNDDLTANSDFFASADSAHTYVAKWDTLFFLDLACDGVEFSPDSTNGEGFYHVGEVANVVFPHNIYLADARYTFVRCEGSVASQEPTFTFVMTHGGASISAVYSRFEVSAQDTIIVTGTLAAIPVILHAEAATPIDSAAFIVRIPDFTYTGYVFSSGVAWTTFSIADVGTHMRVFGKFAATQSVAAHDTLFYIVGNVIAADGHTTAECDSFRFDLALATNTEGHIFCDALSTGTFALVISADSPEISTVAIDGINNALPYSADFAFGSVHEISVPDTYYSAVSGERFIFSEWSDGCADATRSLLIAADTVLVAHYNREAAFGIFDAHACALPESVNGTYWQPLNSAIEARISTVDSLEHTFAASYLGAGALDDGIGALCLGILARTAAISWQWSPLAQLTIAAEFGIFAPAETIFVVPGSHLDIAAGDFALTAPNTRLRHSNWHATGAISPISGLGSVASVDILGDATLTFDNIAQYRLVLAAMGNGAAPAHLIGAGWYDAAALASCSADTELSDAAHENHYFFDYWHGAVGGTPVADVPTPEFELAITAPALFFADYSRGVHIAVQKFPEHASGFIEADGIRHVATSELGIWRRRFAETALAVSVADTISAYAAYLFSNWASGLSDAAFSFVAQRDTLVVAEYDTAFRVAISRFPASTSGTLTLDGVVYAGLPSVYLSNYYKLGSTHTIAVSNFDIVDADHRFAFTAYSTGTLTTSTAFTVTGADSINAGYTLQNSVRVTKNPAETHGSITIAGTVFPNVSSAMGWAFADSTISISVSTADLAPLCSLYSFASWSDGTLTATREIVAALPQDLTANYTADTVKIDIELTRDYWDMRAHVLDAGATRTMAGADSIKISSFSTLPLQLGLQLLPHVTFAAAREPNVDAFVLRGVFNDGGVPARFSVYKDWVGYNVVWATSEIYGPGGFNVAPSTTEKLWLQFVAPTSMSVEGSYTFNLLLWSRVKLP